jgi:Mg/Co/Ni transporter MgtE
MRISDAHLARRLDDRDLAGAKEARPAPLRAAAPAGGTVGACIALVLATIASLRQSAPHGIPLPGLDHAPGADPFITTIKDFTGLAVYFGLAATLLGVG